MSGPFDKAHYAALLEGLELSEIRKSALLLDNVYLRFDSEFHRKEYYRAITATRRNGAEQFGDSQPLIIHPVEIKRDYVEEGTWFFRAQNLRAMQIDESDKVFVSSDDAKSLIRNQIDNGDVVITRSGANRGDCAFFDSPVPAIASSHTFIVRSTKWNHAFLVAFLNSKYGKLQIDKGVYGAAQPEIAPYYLKSIWIPKLSKRFQNDIERLFRKSCALKQGVITHLANAEQTLLAALGLADWHPPEPLTYTHFRKEVFEAKRLDSEYFSPKFEALKSELELRHTLKTLQSIGDVLKGVTVAYSDEGQFPIIRSGDLSDISVDDRFKRSSEVNDIFYLKKGDILLASIGFGAIGKVQVFDREGRYGTVSEVTVVRQHYFNSYYLAAYLRSVAGQMQIERYITGATGQLHLYPKDVAKIFVPVIPVAQQRYFETLALQAASSKSEARALLSRAQRAVEIAIEEDEASALRFLKEKGV